VTDVSVGAMHQIGEVAAEVGLSLRTIRHYEEVGLVPPSGRTTGGFRLYTERDIERLRLVKQMKPLGFTLDEMRDLLEVRDRLESEVTAHDARDVLLGELRDYARQAEERCEKLREQLNTAEGLVRTLRREANRRPPGNRER